MLWRRFLVRSDSTLADLHVVLQIGFDWTDFHLHRFVSVRKTTPCHGLALSCHDARKITLADLQFRINKRFLYDLPHRGGNVRQRIRKVLKNRSHFPSDEAATKLIYLALRNITKSWTNPPPTWRMAANQFAIQFGERFNK